MNSRMGSPASPRPTDAELEILKVLWPRGTATVRDIQDDLTKSKKIAYSSIATTMRVLVEKEMVEIVDLRRPQKCRATITEIQARKAVTDAWLARMFGGSLIELLRSVLIGRRLEKKEIDELTKLIESANLWGCFSNPLPLQAPLWTPHVPQPVSPECGYLSQPAS